MSDEQTLRNQSIPSFRFVVEIDGLTKGVFTECTLPTVEWEIEEVKEGGLNTHTHQLPGRRKGSKLTLKNGVGKTDLMQWYIDSMGETFHRRNVTVKLLNAKKQAVMTWDLMEAYPVKWTGPQLKSSENSIAIQTLELACGYVGVTAE